VSRGWRWLALPLAALPAGCVVGPNYQAPHPAVPASFAAAAQVPGAATGAPAGALEDWWARFHDPELDALITKALQGNLTLKLAASRVQEAREQVRVAGAARQPRVNADADASALHLSDNSGFSELSNFFTGSRGSSSNGFTLPGGNITTYTVGFDASWEIDLFGGVRRSVQAAEAATEQAVWQRRDSEVSVAAEVANDYWLLRSLQRQIQIAHEEIARQQQMLSLLEQQQRFGFVTDRDVQSQAAQLAAARATVPDLEAARDAQIHALGVLIGDSPDALQAQLAAARALPPPPPAVPVGLPSELLRRRPDVRAAERGVAASSARIGVAVAQLYPRINLTGALDLVSLDLRHLLDIASRQYDAAGGLIWPLFAGGRGHADVRIATEQNRQALFAYQSTVLGALREVADALTRYADELQKNRALREAVAHAQSAADIAERQFKAGIINVTPTLMAEGAVLQARLQLAQSDGALDRDLVSLYKALGGGWH
jgi:NodT family efflux transporter outer membrane factor (OMF) lipoprotein